MLGSQKSEHKLQRSGETFSTSRARRWFHSSSSSATAAPLRPCGGRFTGAMRYAYGSSGSGLRQTIRFSRFSSLWKREDDLLFLFMPSSVFLCLRGAIATRTAIPQIPSHRTAADRSPSRPPRRSAPASPVRAKSRPPRRPWLCRRVWLTQCPSLRPIA